MAYVVEDITINTSNGEKLATKQIRSSDCMTGLTAMYSQHSPLHSAIEMVNYDNDVDYILQLLDNKSIDVDAKTIMGITPLFLSIQYSIVNKDLKRVFVKIVDKKIKKNSSFDDFKQNMALVKHSYPSSYDDYSQMIKSWIGEELAQKILN